MPTGLTPHPSAEKGRSHTIAPTTLAGRWAVGFAAASVMLVLAWPLVGRFGGVLGLVLGLAGGAVALDAIRSGDERAPAVYLALVPAATAAVFVLASLLSG